MELRRSLSLVLLATFLMTVRVQGVRLSITPNIIVDGKTPTLTIRCDTDAAASDTVYVIKITKPPSLTNLAFVDTNGVARVDPSIQQRATATGTVSPAAGSSLTLTFNDAITCGDAGDYSCQFTSLNTQNPTSNQTVQATSDPHSIEMMARPTYVTYSVNTTVELVCSGSIGKPATGNWVWETRDEAFGSSWTPLRFGLTPVDETPAASGLCQMTGRSTLTFQVQVEDDNRMYRCFFRDSQHSANFTFNVLGTSTPSAGGNTGGDENPAQGNTGMIVGIVLGILALIAIVVVLVFFFVFRKKRSKGNDYDTGEGKNGPAANTDAELHGNPVYTLPSTHTKYAMDNEGMESSTDDGPEEVVDPRRKKENEEEEKKKQKSKSLISGLQSNQLFQRRSMKNNKDKDDRYGADNHAMDGNSEPRDQDPNDRHARSRRDPYAGEGGRRGRDRHDRDHDRHDRHDRDHYQPEEAPYPESRSYDQSFEDDGTDNRGYVPPEAIGSAV